MTTHGESKPRRRWPTYLAVVLVLVLVVYPLSIGPALVIASYMGPGLLDTIESLYAPVYYVVDKTGAVELFTAYITWWLEIAS